MLIYNILIFAFLLLVTTISDPPDWTENYRWNFCASITFVSNTSPVSISLDITYNIYYFDFDPEDFSESEKCNPDDHVLVSGHGSPINKIDKDQIKYYQYFFSI